MGSFLWHRQTLKRATSALTVLPHRITLSQLPVKGNLLDELENFCKVGIIYAAIHGMWDLQTKHGGEYLFSVCMTTPEPVAQNYKEGRRDANDTRSRRPEKMVNQGKQVKHLIVSNTGGAGTQLQSWS